MSEGGQASSRAMKRRRRSSSHVEDEGGLSPRSRQEVDEEEEREEEERDDGAEAAVGRRRRLGLGPLPQAFASLDASEPEGVRQRATGTDVEADDVELSDTVAALSLLAGRLHGQGRFASCPIILRHQVYTILDDATAVDMELEQLRRQNYLRMIKLQTQSDEVGLLRTSTYQARIMAAVDKAATPERKEALLLFREVVGEVTNLSVSLEEIASLHHQRMPTTAAATTAAAVKAQELDVLIQHLVKAGFLVPRREGGQQVYWFSAPEAGSIAASIPPGRQAILAAIARSRYKEVLDKNVDKIKIPKSQLSAAFHLVDLVGSGEIMAVTTSAGIFYRVKK